MDITPAMPNSDIIINPLIQGVDVFMVGDSEPAINAELYPFDFSNWSIFSWRAIANQLSVCPAKPDINIKCWLAIARHEKIDNFEKPNGYNSCNAQLWFVHVRVWVSVTLYPFR